MKHEAQARDWRYVATVADPDEDWTYIDRTPGARITIQDRDASYVEIGTDDAGPVSYTHLTLPTKRIV